MPLLISNDTGLAEDLPQDQATQALAANTHEVPLVDPEGNSVSAPMNEAQQWLQKGYKQPNPEQLNTLADYAKNQSTSEQAKAFLEGAGRSNTFGLSTGVETALGVNPEDIERRQKSGYGTAGEVAGYGLSALTGVGEAKALEKAGEVGAKALGRALPFLESKIGSAAAKTAIETGLYSGGDKVTEAFLGDPGMAVETAIPHMLASGLIGGGVGAFGAGVVSPLWKAAMESKSASALKHITDRLGGIEGAVETPVDSALQKLGIADTVSPEIRSALSDNPMLREAASVLSQTDTNVSGRKYQEAYNNFRKGLSESVAQTLGKEPSQIEGMQVSEASHGKNIGDVLSKEYNQKIEPVSKIYNDFADKFKGAELVPDTVGESGEKIPGTVSNLQDKILDAASKEGWSTRPSSDIMQNVNSIVKELPLQKDLKNLSDFIKNINMYEIGNGELNRAGGVIKGILREEEGNIIGSHIGSQEGEEALNLYNSNRKDFGKVAQIKDAINDRLKIKSSVSGYGNAIKEMAGTDSEALARRMSGVNDSNLLEVLSNQFPKTAEAVKDYHLDKILEKAVGQGKGSEILSTQRIVNALDPAKNQSMSPELRNFIASPEQLDKINSVGQILKQLEDRTYNFSNTARTASKLATAIPGAALGAISALTGHNPLIGVALGGLASMFAKDVPDAVRLSLLKLMGSNKEINAGAFKSLVDFAASSLKGENMLSRGTSALLDATKDVIPSKMTVTDDERKKLDKRVTDLNQNPEKLFNIGKDTGYYSPEHSASMAETATRVVSYLGQLQPKTEKANPLDKPMPHSDTETARYNDALTIAQQPLTVLKEIKSGTLTQNDVKDIQSMYPSLYANMSNKITEQIINHTSKGLDIPYKIRQTFSLFLQQPLDSTMTQNALASAYIGQVQQQNQAPYKTNQKGSMNPLSKISSMDMTHSQSREMKNNLRS